jgi:hypothetical protein
VNRSREWRQIQRDAQREIGSRAYAIHRQPWLSACAAAGRDEDETPAEGEDSAP